MRAILVHAISAEAKVFYEKHGFRPSPVDPMALMITLNDARRMLADEFVNYDTLPQYHRMFEAMGITRSLEAFRNHREISDRDTGGVISEVSLANPNQGQVIELLGRFREAGVDSPVVYPYVSGTDEYKLSIVKRLGGWLD